MAKRLNLKGIELGRTIGIEVEGYTKNFPKLNQGVRHCQIKQDASLSNSYGWYINRNEGVTVGAEVVSVPLSKLDMLDEMFEDIQASKWHIGRGKASTHIHVDANDFTLYERIKMAIFMEKLDNAMFLMVKKNRHTRRGFQRNRYCAPLSPEWKALLDRANEVGVDVNRYDDIGSFIFEIARIERNRGTHSRFPHYNRYNFANIFSTGRGTIEFRLFHSIRDSKEAKKFGLIAYNLVETVKNSTLEHLNFIADSVNNSGSAEEMVEKLSTSIGLDFTPKIHNNRLKNTINQSKSRTVAV
jgi:hypothetical protein